MTKGCLSNVGHTFFKKKLNFSWPWKEADLEFLAVEKEELLHIIHDGSKPLAYPEYGRDVHATTIGIGKGVIWTVMSVCRTGAVKCPFLLIPSIA
ncbi:MAG: hypothetical protein OXH65_05900 [Paracoccaceae bacterium]|nr:hypothetical protein [Paracoccaceae bacterium]MDE2674626.1 hypothetical protein [Paracoccaceae bacterium]